MSDSSNSSIATLVLDSITALEAIRQTLEEHGIDPDILKFPEFNIPVGVKLALMYDRKPLVWTNWPPNKALEAGRGSNYAVSQRLTEEEDQFLRERKKHINDNYRIRHLVHDSMWGLEEDA